MATKRNKLAVALFVLAMTSTVRVYSQSDYMLVSGTTMTYDERQLEIFQEVKTCIGTEDVRILQTKNEKIFDAWFETEVENYRHVLLSFIKETDVYVSMSLPQDKAEENAKNLKKYRKSKEYKEAMNARFAILEKAQTCLAAADIRVIETKDAEQLSAWIKAEDEDRNITNSFDAETGTFIAISSPKSDGGGKVNFKRID
jgi:hypothetical protein